MKTENYHAEEAQRIVGLQVDSESLESVAVAIEALVQSNLAVAREARIANLIALTQVKLMPVPSYIDISGASKDIEEILTIMKELK